MSSQSNTSNGDVDPRRTMAHIERLAKEKCELPGTCSVPEVKTQQILEINAEANAWIIRYCVERPKGGES